MFESYHPFTDRHALVLDKYRVHVPPSVLAQHVVVPTPPTVSLTVRLNCPYPSTHETKPTHRPTHLLLCPAGGGGIGVVAAQRRVLRSAQGPRQRGDGWHGRGGVGVRLLDFIRI